MPDQWPEITTTIANGEKTCEAARQLRAALPDAVVAVLGGPHCPELTDDEVQRVCDKVAYLLVNETRAQYWLTLRHLVSVPRNADGVAIVTPLMLQWAGRSKPKAYREITPKARHAKNGRVLRDTKGMS